MSGSEDYENESPRTWREVLTDPQDMAIVIGSVVVAAYYYSANWLHSQGMMGELPMMFVNVVTLIVGGFLAANAVLMFRDGRSRQRGDPK